PPRHVQVVDPTNRVPVMTGQEAHRVAAGDRGRRRGRGPAYPLLLPRPAVLLLLAARPVDRGELAGDQPPARPAAQADSTRAVTACSIIGRASCGLVANVTLAGILAAWQRSGSLVQDFGRYSSRSISV